MSTVVSPIVASIRAAIIGGVGNYADGGIVFSAASYDTASFEAELQSLGEGTPTSTHTADIYAKDADSVYQLFSENDPVWEGARVTLTGAAGTAVTGAYVDDGSGNVLTNQPWLVYQPALTNSAQYSNDQTNAWWTATNVTPVQDEIGLTGEPNTACTLTATAANGTVIGTVITAASDTHATKWWIKRKTGTGDIDLTMDNGSGWTTVTLTSEFDHYEVEQAALTDPQIGIRIVTDGDAVIVGNGECHTAATEKEIRGAGPIFTSGATGTTDRTVYQFDILNHSQPQGAYFLEWMPSLDSDPASNTGLISLTNGPGSLLYTHPSVASRFQSTDGTNYTTLSDITFANDDVLKCAVVYSASEAENNINIDATWIGTDGTYDGAYLISSAMEIFYSAAAAQKIRNLKRYNLAYDAAKTQIDADMVIHLTGDYFDTPLVDGDGNELTG